MVFYPQNISYKAHSLLFASFFFSVVEHSEETLIKTMHNYDSTNNQSANTQVKFGFMMWVFYIP